MTQYRGSVSSVLPGPLTVLFVDRAYKVASDDEDGLVFGRGATLDLDSNPFLHRQVGRFVARSGVWWLENLNGWTELSVTTAGAPTTIRCQDRTALHHPDTTVSFEAGTCRYELHAVLSEVPALTPPLPPLEDQTLTRPPPKVELTSEERLLAVALAEPRLRSGVADTRMPTNRHVANRLGWSTTQFNRKLDYLCRRLARKDVKGLAGTNSKRARHRRQHLVEHLIRTRMITAADLDLLDAYPDHPKVSKR